MSINDEAETKHNTLKMNTNIKYQAVTIRLKWSLPFVKKR